MIGDGWWCGCGLMMKMMMVMVDDDEYVMTEFEGCWWVEFNLLRGSLYVWGCIPTVRSRNADLLVEG